MVAGQALYSTRDGVMAAFLPEAPLIIVRAISELDAVPSEVIWTLMQNLVRLACPHPSPRALLS